MDGWLGLWKKGKMMEKEGMNDVGGLVVEISKE